MIVVNLMGGVGNQLFQYAAGRALAKWHGVELTYFFDDHYKLAKRNEKLTNFSISARPLRPGEALDYFPKKKVIRRILKFFGLPYDGKMYTEKVNFKFDHQFFSLPKDVLLYGCWQSHYYLKTVTSELREELVIKNPSARFLAAVARVSTLNNTVAIHIRRGDYLNSRSGFSPLPLEYYTDATNRIASQIGKYTPVIFTDDVNWVKEHFSFMESAFFVAGLELEDFEELVLMTACEHHIIANSSFSWWGAWLNGKQSSTVIAPLKWMIDEFVDTKELIPENWIRL